MQVESVFNTPPQEKKDFISQSISTMKSLSKCFLKNIDHHGRCKMTKPRKCHMVVKLQKYIRTWNLRDWLQIFNSSPGIIHLTLFIISLSFAYFSIFYIFLLLRLFGLLIFSLFFFLEFFSMQNANLNYRSAN